MNLKDGDVCLKAFNELCEQLTTSKLLNLEECEYWMFESCYKAALDELISNMSIAANSQGRLVLDREYIVRKAA
jgi:hypothetical protein